MRRFNVQRHGMRWALPVLWAALPLTLRPGFGHAAESGQPAPDVATEQRQATQLSERELTRLTLRATGENGAVFKTTGESLLKWSNPDAGRVYGDVYLWTDKGRPAVLASIFRWYSPFQSLNIEFCSLSTHGIVVDHGGQVIWEPADAGITWQELPGADTPAGSRPARLTQMKRIAGRFTAKLSDARGNPAAVDRVLRLLPRPVFRYGTDATVDGALFAFVVGTDPELLVLVESTATGWRYALSRANRDPLAVSLDGRVQQAFEYIPSDQLFNSRAPYACYVVVDFARPESAPQTP